MTRSAEFKRDNPGRDEAKSFRAIVSSGPGSGGPEKSVFPPEFQHCPARKRRSVRAGPARRNIAKLRVNMSYSS